MLLSTLFHCHIVIMQIVYSNNVDIMTIIPLPCYHADYPKVPVYYRLFKGGLLKTLPAFAEFGMKDLLPLKINRPDEGCIRSVMTIPICTLHLQKGRYRDTTKLVKPSVRRGAHFDRNVATTCRVKVVCFGSLFLIYPARRGDGTFCFPSLDTTCRCAC
jgi:hypothetical protein